MSDGHPGELRPGDRMRDLAVTVLNREGSAEQAPKPATVFDLMDPSTFTLFYSSIADPAKTHAEIGQAIGKWHYLMHGHQVGPADNVAGFEKLFGKGPGILLVRPDGYVALTGTDKSVPALANYCDKWLQAGTTFHA